MLANSVSMTLKSPIFIGIFRLLALSAMFYSSFLFVGIFTFNRTMNKFIEKQKLSRASRISCIAQHLLRCWTCDCWLNTVRNATRLRLNISIDSVENKIAASIAYVWYKMKQSKNTTNEASLNVCQCVLNIHHILYTYTTLNTYKSNHWWVMTNWLRYTSNNWLSLDYWWNENESIYSHRKHVNSTYMITNVIFKAMIDNCLRYWKHMFCVWY